MNTYYVVFIFVSLFTAPVTGATNCYSGIVASDYRGETAVDANGNTCSNWAGTTYETKYPDSGLDGNRCRNPNAKTGGTSGGAFCVRNNALSYCSIAMCTAEGALTPDEAKLSSTYIVADTSHPAALAIDGDSNTYAMTRSELTPYLEVYLKALNYVTKVELSNPDAAESMVTLFSGAKVQALVEGVNSWENCSPPSGTGTYKVITHVKSSLGSTGNFKIKIIGTESEFEVQMNDPGTTTRTFSYSGKTIVGDVRCIEITAETTDDLTLEKVTVQQDASYTSTFDYSGTLKLSTTSGAAYTASLKLCTKNMVFTCKTKVKATQVKISKNTGSAIDLKFPEVSVTGYPTNLGVAVLPNTDVAVGYKATLTCGIQDPVHVDHFVPVWKEASGSDPKTFTLAQEYEGYVVALSKSASGGYTASSTLVIDGDKVTADKGYICEVTDLFHTATAQNVLRTFSINTSGTKVVKVGTAATLTCAPVFGASSFVTWNTAAWYKGSTKYSGSTVSTHVSLLTSVLTLKLASSVVKGDELYTCEFEADDSNNYQHVVSLETFDMAITSTRALKGDKNTFTCTVTGLPYDKITSNPKTVTWGANSQTYGDSASETSSSYDSESGTLTSVLTLTVSASIEYTCSIQVDSVTYTEKATFKIFEMETVNPPFHTRYGASATVTCKVTGIEAELEDIRWTAGGATHTAAVSGSGYEVNEGVYSASGQIPSLVVNAASANSLTLDCEVKVEGAWWKRSYTLQMFEISITTSPGAIGQSAYLTCTVSNGISPANSYDVSWYEEDAKLADGSAFDVAEVNYGNTLEVKNVATVREYTCRVTISADSRKYEEVRSTNLFTMSSTPGTVYYGPGTAATLTSSFSNLVTSVVPENAFSWTIDSTTHTSFPYSDSTYTITVSDLTYVAGEGYTQTSTLIKKDISKLTSKSLTSKVTVQSKTYQKTVIARGMDMTQTSTEVLAGTDAVLECKVAQSGLESATTYWKSDVYDQGVIDGNTAESVGLVSAYASKKLSLTINKQYTHEDSSFTCYLENGGNTYIGHAQVKVYEASVNSIEVHTGVKSTLTCLVESVDAAPASIKWYRDAKECTDGSDFDVTYSSGTYSSSTESIKSTLVVNSPVSDEFYTCSVETSNADGKVYGRVVGSLYIYGIHKQNAPVLSGENTVLTCTVTGYTQIISSDMIKWTTINGGLEVTSGVGWDKEKTTLSLSNIQEDAEYTCGVKVDGVWAYKVIEVDVFSIETISDLNKVGEVASPACLIHDVSISDLATVHWKLGSNYVYVGARKEEHNDDVLDVTVTTDQTYTCTITFELNFGKKTYDRTLTVDAVDMHAYNSLQVQGAAVDLTCVVTKIQRLSTGTSWDKSTNAGSNAYTSETDTELNKDQSLYAKVVKADKATTEGKWNCYFNYFRSNSLTASSEKTRVLKDSLYLDVTELTKVPQTQYIATDATTTFTCTGRKTINAQSIIPKYTWTVNNVAQTGTTSTNTEVGFLSVKAEYVLDKATVLCTVTWYTDPTTITLVMTSSALLYSKHITVAPDTKLFVAKGGTVKATCVVNTLYQDITSVKWYKGTSTVTEITSSTSGYSIDNTKVDTEHEDTSVLTVTNVQATDNLKCVWDYSATTAANRNYVLNIENVMTITKEPQGAAIESGSDYTFTCDAKDDSYYTQIKYEWYKNGNLVQTNTMTKSDTAPLRSEYNPGVLIYKADKDNTYKCKVTWTWANNGNQVVEVTSPETTMTMTDTCHVFYDELNSQTTAAPNTDKWILNGVKITTTCDRGYIKPKKTDGSAGDYIYTCAVDDGATDADMKFINCEGGNVVNDAPQYSTYSYDDAAKLAITGPGATTVHKGTVATVTCDSGYTLRKAWSKTTTCNGADASICTFDGNCVIGCAYTKNAYTKTAYVTNHDENLVADKDTYTYSCVADSFTTTGATQYTEPCDHQGKRMYLYQCKPGRFAGFTLETRETTLKLSWAKPVYPEASAVKYMFQLVGADNFTESKSTTGREIAFYNLSPGGTYNVSEFHIHYSGGSWEPSATNTYSYTIPKVKIVEDRDSGVLERSLDIPVLDYMPAEYQILMTWFSEFYDNSRDQLRITYKYASTESSESNSGSGPKNYRRRRDVNSTTLDTVVYIYPSAHSMYESGAKVGAFVSERLTNQQVAELNGRYTWTPEYSTLESDCSYYVSIRACHNFTENCEYGQKNTIIRSAEDGMFIVFIIAVPLIIILFAVILICMWKGPCARLRLKSMDTEWVDEDGEVIANQAFEMYLPAKGELKLRTPSPESEGRYANGPQPRVRINTGNMTID